jgi:hypothetical protein
VRKALRAAAIVWSVVAAVAHSDTGVPFPLWMMLTGSGFLILFVWLLAIILVAAVRSPGDDPLLARVRSWLAIPLPIVATLLVIWLSIPLTARLFFSGPALRQSATYLTQLPPDRMRQHPPWIGLFRVREFTQFGDELRFLTTSCGIVGSCGLVFSPDGRPPGRGEDTFVHLYAEWWQWHQSW